jgi:hypothetical protein
MWRRSAAFRSLFCIAVLHDVAITPRDGTAPSLQDWSISQHACRGLRSVSVPGSGAAKLTR